MNSKLLGSLSVSSGNERPKSAEEDFLAYAAYVGHELRRPLSAMNLSVSVLSDSELKPDQYEVVSSLSRQLDHVQALVQDLWDLAVGTKTLHYKPTDLVAVLFEVREMVKPTLDQKSQVLVLEGVDRSALISADRHLLVQVFRNLVDNASKYSPPESAIRLIVSLQDRKAIVKVCDEGAGIDAEALPHVFEPFYRSGSASASAVKGNGLGLAIAHQIVTAHGGEMTLDSDGPGHGCTASVTLPFQKLELFQDLDA